MLRFLSLQSLNFKLYLSQLSLSLPPSPSPVQDFILNNNLTYDLEVGNSQRDTERNMYAIIYCSTIDTTYLCMFFANGHCNYN